MQALNYSIEDYVADLKKITGEENEESAIVKRATPLAKKFASQYFDSVPDQLLECDQKQGFAFHLIHEDPDHSHAVFMLAWLPGRGTPPHNHMTWGVVVGIMGEETETRWSRMQDAEKTSPKILRELDSYGVQQGDVSCILSDEIHSVLNKTDEVSLSLHTYGKHINHTGRSSFDLDRNVEMPFLVDA